MTEYQRGLADAIAAIRSVCPDKVRMPRRDFDILVEAIEARALRAEAQAAMGEYDQARVSGAVHSCPGCNDCRSGGKR